MNLPARWDAVLGVGRWDDAGDTGSVGSVVTQRITGRDWVYLDKIGEERNEEESLRARKQN